MCVRAVLGASRMLSDVCMWSSRCIKGSVWADTNDSSNGLLIPPKCDVGAEVKDGAHGSEQAPLSL